MRDQLRDIEGQLVFIEGRVTSYSNRNGKKYICLQRPLVIPWDGNRALKASAEDQLIEGLDHLWVQTSGHDQIEMMRHVLSCSRVKWYARKDGSVDLGTEPLHTLLNHDKEIERFMDARKAPPRGAPSPRGGTKPRGSFSAPAPPAISADRQALISGERSEPRLFCAP